VYRKKELIFQNSHIQLKRRLLGWTGQLDNGSAQVVLADLKDSIHSIPYPVWVILRFLDNDFV
jgi:hypothetical protein